MQVLSSSFFLVAARHSMATDSTEHVQQTTTRSWQHICTANAQKQVNSCHTLGFCRTRPHKNRRAGATSSNRQLAQRTSSQVLYINVNTAARSCPRFFCSCCTEGHCGHSSCREPASASAWPVTAPARERQPAVASPQVATQPSAPDCGPSHVHMPLVCHRQTIAAPAWPRHAP